MTAAPADALAECFGRVTGRKCRRAASNLGESDRNRGVTTAVSCISDARREAARREAVEREAARREAVEREAVEREAVEREVLRRAG